MERSDAARPRVVVTSTTSVDGRVTLRRDRLLLDPATGVAWQSLSPPSASAAVRRRSALIRDLYRPTAVLEGSGTFVVEDAGPVWNLPPPLESESVSEEILYEDFLPPEKALRPDHTDWFVVVDGRGRVRWEFTGGGGTDLLVLVARSTPAAYLSFLRRERICYLVVGDEGVDLGAALSRLRERLAVTCVVADAGGGLNAALLRAGFVDEIHLIIVPAVVGGRDTPSVFDGPPLLDGLSATRLELLSVEAEADGLLSLRYRVLDEVRHDASWP